MSIAEERLRELRVWDVMTRQVVTVPSSVSAAEAARLMTDAKVTAAPVVDAQGECVGIVSATDFLRVVSSNPDVDLRQLPVSEIHSCAVQSVSANATVLRAARMMCAQHIHRLLVLDDRGRPTGILSSLDVVAMMVKAIDESDMAGADS